MKLCSACGGVGCEHCSFEGVDAGMTFTKKKIIKSKNLNYAEHKEKVDKEHSKINKKSDIKEGETE